jgi:hypothetical protein
MTDLMQPWNVERSLVTALADDLPSKIADQIMDVRRLAGAHAAATVALWRQYRSLTPVLAAMARDESGEPGDIQVALEELTGLDTAWRVLELAGCLAREDDVPEALEQLRQIADEARAR